MKKIITLVIVGLLLIGLVACGDIGDVLSRSDGSDSQQTGSNSLGGLDIGAILAGNGDTGTILGNLSAADKQALIAEAQQDGVEVTFNADGTTTIKDSDGTIMVQKADGTWSFVLGDGGEGQIGGTWPDNEFTRMLPKPEFTLLAAAIEDGSFSAGFSGVSNEAMKTYIAELKKAGFNLDIEDDSTEFGGISVVSYTASNSAGYEVNVTATSGTGSLSLGKKDDDQSSPGSGTSGAGGNYNFGAILAGNGDTGTILSNMSAADKQAMIDEAKKEGVEVTFNADGTTTIKDSNGTQVVQKADGTFTFTIEGGGEGQYGGNWPDNEFTRMLPKPEFTLLAASIEDGNFSAAFSGISSESMNAYIAELKKSGFNLEIEDNSVEFGGISVVSYTASNSAGYEVNVTATSGAGSLTIGKK